MPDLAYTVSPLRGGWALDHKGVRMATFDTKEEAERAALAIAVRHPKGKVAQVDLENQGAPTSTVLIF